MAKHTPKRRGNNEGTISKRADGRWEARVTIGRDPKTGRPQRASFYGATREEAGAKLVKALGDVSRGAFVKPEKMTLGQWLDTWLQEYKKPGVRPASFQIYEKMTRLHIKPNLGHLPVKDLRPEHLQRLYNEKLEAGLSARTVRIIHVALRQALDQAMKSGLLVRNVSAAARAPKTAKKELNPLTLDEVKTLLDANRDERLFPAILLELSTGLRRGELLGLRWQDLDLKAGVLHVRQSLARLNNREEDGPKTCLVFHEPKTALSRRTVPLSGEVVEELKRYKARQAEEKLFLGQAYQDRGLVFCREDGAPYDPSWFGTGFLRRWIAKAGLRPIHFHGLRHSFATLMLELNEHPKTVQTMLGHSNIAMTLDLYSHVSLELERKAAERLGATLTERKPKIRMR